MSDREYGMPDLLNLQEFDEEALKKESEEVLGMRLINSENGVRPCGRIFNFPADQSGRIYFHS